LYRDIPDDVWNLLQDRITGLDELKTLLLVSGDPSKSWTASSVAAHLGTRTLWIDVVLAKLCAAGLLVGEGEEAERRFWYRPDTPALAAAVGSLAEIYDHQRVNVILILSHKAMNRIRQAAFRTFAGALVSRRNEPPAEEDR
jgi:hypothetical protein